MTRRFGRKSLSDTIRANQRALNHMAAMAGVEPHPDLVQAVAPKRKRRTRSASGKPLERNILKAVLDALRHHPRVAFADRRQSGVFVDGERHIRVGSVGVGDISGMLKVSGRYFEIEVKTETGKATDAQITRMNMIWDAGGIAGIARSVEAALTILEMR